MTVIPKLASTVVLMDHLSRVYLTKRPKTMKFFGGFFVFPGGAVEKSDYVQNSSHVKAKIQNQSFESAHYLAAARELFEEVGVLLCHRNDGSPVLFTEEREMEYRRQLMGGEISFIQMLENEGLYLNLECLQYFGHMVTPKERTIRYDTRFFLAQLPKGQLPKPDLNEIDEALWLSPDDALAASHCNRISLPRPTIQALQSVRNYLNGSPLNMPDKIS